MIIHIPLSQFTISAHNTRVALYSYGSVSHEIKDRFKSQRMTNNVHTAVWHCWLPDDWWYHPPSPDSYDSSFWNSQGSTSPHRGLDTSSVSHESKAYFVCPVSVSKVKVIYCPSFDVRARTLTAKPRITLRYWEYSVFTLQHRVDGTPYVLETHSMGRHTAALLFDEDGPSVDSIFDVFEADAQRMSYVTGQREHELSPVHVDVDAASLDRLVSIEIQKGLKYSEDQLVLSHWHLAHKRVWDKSYSTFWRTVKVRKPYQKTIRWVYAGKHYTKTVTRWTKGKRRVPVRNEHFHYAYKRVIEAPAGYPLWMHSNAEFNRGKSLVYLRALETFPTAGENQLKLLFSSMGALWHFAFNRKATEEAINGYFESVKGKNRHIANMTVILPALPEKYRSGWFGGRYVLNCAVMNADDAYRYFYHQMQIAFGTETEAVTCEGHRKTQDGEKWNCTFRMEEKARKGISAFFEKAYQLGLEPNAYVVWDLIPYSFVVDWFLPIGNALSAYTKQCHYTPMYYEWLKEYGEYSFMYSVKYSFDTSFGMCTSYCRWYESAPPNVDTCEVLHEKPHVKLVTQQRRAVDAVCLLFR